MKLADLVLDQARACFLGLLVLLFICFIAALFETFGVSAEVIKLVVRCVFTCLLIVTVCWLIGTFMLGIAAQAGL